MINKGKEIFKNRIIAKAKEIFQNGGEIFQGKPKKDLDETEKQATEELSKEILEIYSNGMTEINHIKGKWEKVLEENERAAKENIEDLREKYQEELENAENKWSEKLAEQIMNE